MHPSPRRPLPFGSIPAGASIRIWAPLLAVTLLLSACDSGPGESREGPEGVATATTATSLDLPACASLADPTPGSCVFATTGFYTSKEPYAPRQDPDDYQPVPAGFTVVSVQHVARHGSRALSSPDDDDLMRQLWEAARDEGALTSLGEGLGLVLDDVIRVHAQVGYGRTSRLGELEHEASAARLLERHPAFFDSLVARGHRIDVYHSGRERADQSGEAFVRGLVAGQPDLASLVDPGEPSVETLYFNEAEGSEEYQEYSENDPRMLAAVRAIEEDPRTRQMARLMLRQLFADDFVQRLADGAYEFRASADPDDRIRDELDAAEALYGLYSIAVGLSEEAEWGFGRFMHPEALAWFAYVDDAGSFYDRGPGFADEDITFAGARALAANMVQRIEEVLAGASTVPVTVRFSHAQALMPLAAWLGIEGAAEGAEPGVLYTYENSAWRSELVSPMAANVQWDVVRNAEGVVLVRMLHQEGEVGFAAPCRPWQERSFFYEFEELRRCYSL